MPKSVSLMHFYSKVKLSTNLIECLQIETIVSLLQQLELFDGGN